mgnify:CR=1 FL=1
MRLHFLLGKPRNILRGFIVIVNDINNFTKRTNRGKPVSRSAGQMSWTNHQGWWWEHRDSSSSGYAFSRDVWLSTPVRSDSDPGNKAVMKRWWSSCGYPRIPVHSRLSASPSYAKEHCPLPGWSSHRVPDLLQRWIHGYLLLWFHSWTRKAWQRKVRRFHRWQSHCMLQISDQDRIWPLGSSPWETIDG